MKRQPLAWLAAAATAVVVVPLGVDATTASWNDAEWVHAGSIGTSSMDCGIDTGYASAASGRFLSGSLLGTELDQLAELTPISLDLAGDGAVTVSPGNALNLGSTPPTSTYANPRNIDLLGGIAGLDLTGLAIGLPIGSAGAVNQYAQVSGYGTAAGAAGLVNDSGGVLVAADTPDDQLPQPATISLDDLLPAAAGIADVELQVGAVGASSVLDGCAALRSALWGDGSVTGVTRDYGIASLGLQLTSPLVAELVGTVETGIDDVSTAVNSLVGTDGLIAGSLRTGLQAALPGLLAVTALQGEVSIDGLDLAGSLGSLLTTPLGDDVLSIDLATGHIDVDLEALLGVGPNGLNDLPPNTEIVLDAAVLNPIIDRVGVLLDDWVQDVVTALTAELRDATLTIDLSSVVRIAGGIDILNVTLGIDAPIGAVLSGTASVVVEAEAAGVVGVLNFALGLLGLPTVSVLITTVLGLVGGLTTGVANTLATVGVAAITQLGTTLTGAITPVVTALGSVVGALPNVVSVMVNVQPDAPNAPPGSAYIGGTSTTTAQYIVSSLRIGLADFLTPSSIAYVSFATAAAGPIAVP